MIMGFHNFLSIFHVSSSIVGDDQVVYIVRDKEWLDVDADDDDEPF